MINTANKTDAFKLKYALIQFETAANRILKL